MLLAVHSFQGVVVSSASSDGYAYLAFTHYEKYASLFFVDNAVFHVCAGYAFKQCDKTHLVARDLYAGCHSFPPSDSSGSAVSVSLRMSESPASLILNAETAKGLAQTPPRSN